jgi:hypothetical protein
MPNIVEIDGIHMDVISLHWGPARVAIVLDLDENGQMQVDRSGLEVRKKAIPFPTVKVDWSDE